MSTFHVFVEGATVEGDAALERLATAMAARYGIPAAELIARMKLGRFRVKANIDRATADTYVEDLAAIGARVIVEQNVPNPPPPLSTPAFTSGLSAAYSSSDASTDLGVLGSDHQTFNLSSIDGSSTNAVATVLEASFTPPLLPRAHNPAPAPKPPHPHDAPLDMFAPPDEEAEMKVEIAADELDYRRSNPSIPPVALPIEASTTPAMRRSNPSLLPIHVPAATSSPARDNPLANPRARLVTGVLLAIIVGFIPAHVVGSIREKSAAKAIDDRVIAAGLAATSEAELTALDDYRVTELDNKRSSHRNIALVSMLIWALVGSGVGYVWFRRMPLRDA